MTEDNRIVSEELIEEVLCLYDKFLNSKLETSTGGDITMTGKYITIYADEPIENQSLMKEDFVKDLHKIKEKK